MIVNYNRIARIAFIPDNERRCQRLGPGCRPVCLCPHRPTGRPIRHRLWSSCQTSYGLHYRSSSCGFRWNSCRFAGHPSVGQQVGLMADNQQRLTISWSDDQISNIYIISNIICLTYDIKCKDSKRSTQSSLRITNTMQCVPQSMISCEIHVHSTALPVLWQSSGNEPIVVTTLGLHSKTSEHKWHNWALCQWVCAQPSLHFSNMVTNWTSSDRLISWSVTIFFW